MLWLCKQHVTFKNYLVYHLPARDEQELSLGMLIRCKRIYNFWCSMSVLHQFLYVSYHFIALFMRFPELTYWRDAAVPVPVFCCFWFQKSCTGNILRIGWNKVRTSYFSEEKTEPEDEVPEALEGPRQGPGAGPGLAAPGLCLATPCTPSRRLFAYKKPLT